MTDLAATMILFAALVLLAGVPVAFVIGTHAGDERRRRRLAQLEEELAVNIEEAEQHRLRQLRHVRHLELRVRNQRRELAVLRQQRDAAVAEPRQFANDVRILLAGKQLKLGGAAIHDGNHAPEECDACDVYRQAEQWATRPWHYVVRGRGRVSKVAQDG